jgi:hypothetical protein
VEFDSDYSYFNDAVTVSAPGTNIVSLYLDGGTATKKGTSFAAPVVTAMAIMAKQRRPSIDTEAFVQLLAESSVDLGDSGYDVYYGHGYVNVPAFLAALDSAIAAPPAVSVQPADMTAAVGQTAVFSVEAAGHDLSYQWYLRTPTDTGWRRITESTPSASTAALAIKATASKDGWAFRCVVRNSHGSVTTEQAVLSVLPAPSVTAQPEDVTVAVGQMAVFTVAADGDALAYQWYLRSPSDSGWRRITASTPSASTDTLTIPGKASFDGYSFRCIVKTPVAPRSVKRLSSPSSPRHPSPRSPRM